MPKVAPDEKSNRKSFGTIADKPKSRKSTGTLDEKPRSRKSIGATDEKPRSRKSTGTLDEKPKSRKSIGATDAKPSRRKSIGASDEKPRSRKSDETPSRRKSIGTSDDKSTRRQSIGASDEKPKRKSLGTVDEISSRRKSDEKPKRKSFGSVDEASSRRISDEKPKPRKSIGASRRKSRLNEDATNGDDEDDTAEGQSHRPSRPSLSVSSKKKRKSTYDIPTPPMEEIKSRKEQRKERRLTKKANAGKDRGENIRSSFIVPPKEIILPAPWAPPTKSNFRSTEGKVSNAGKFIQCNWLTIVMLLVYILAIMITSLAVYCYREDTIWNSIVGNERPFPKIEGEDFFGGKYLNMDIHQKFEDAKTKMLRDNRVFETMHLSFIVVVLVFTAFQIAAYITRGDEDHSRIIICYYTIFGGLGLIAALFPLLSWHNQNKNYDTAASALHAFHKGVQDGDIKMGNSGTGENKVTSGTVNDVLMLARIMTFCYNASNEGVTVKSTGHTLTIYAKKYELTHLQQLGFCTNHKFKIINTVLSTIFALICCTIPCLYCITASTGGTAKVKLEEAAEATKKEQEKPKPPPEPVPPPVKPPPPRKMPLPLLEVQPSPRGEPLPPADVPPPPTEVPPPPAEVPAASTDVPPPLPEEIPVPPPIEQASGRPDKEPDLGMDEESLRREKRRQRREEQRRQRIKSLDELSEYERDQVEKFRIYIENDDELDNQ